MGGGGGGGGGGVYWIPPVRLSVCLSVNLLCPPCSIYSSFHIWYKWSIAWEGVSDVMTLDLDLYLQGLENRVRSIKSAVLDGFFLYLAQMINIIRGCVACYVFVQNFWKFSALTLKKKSSILDGFFPYLAQMITSMRGCVAYNGLWPWPISSRSSGVGLENRVRSAASTVLDGVFP